MSGEFIHIVPMHDLRDHIDSIECWCRPVVDEEEPRVVVHNSMDRREAFETGERKPS